MFLMQIWPVLGQLLEIVLVTGVKAFTRLRLVGFLWLMSPNDVLSGLFNNYFNIGPITLAWMRVNVLSTILNFKFM
jgi:hypothetical protein